MIIKISQGMKQLAKQFAWILILGSVFLLSCAKKNEDEEALKPYQGMSVKALYDYAKSAMDKGDYGAAIKRYEALDSIYPFNQYALNAGFDLVYVYFKDEQYQLAAAQADRLIRVHPQAKNIDYAYYMRGVSNFEQERGSFAKFFKMDLSKRYPGTQLEAYDNFKKLTVLFPNSPYANDANQRLVYLRNLFARKDLNIAKYYIERKEYVAAYNRAEMVVTTYPQAPEAKKALSIMIKSAKALKLTKAEKDAKAIYQATFG